MEYIFQGVRQSIKFPNDEGVPLTELSQQPMQFRPMPTTAERNLFHKVLTTRCDEGLNLHVVDLIADPR